MTGEEGSSVRNSALCKEPLLSVLHVGMFSGDPLLTEVRALRNGEVGWSAFSAAVLVPLCPHEQAAAVFCTLSLLSNYSGSLPETGFRHQKHLVN